MTYVKTREDVIVQTHDKRLALCNGSDADMP